MIKCILSIESHYNTHSFSFNRCPVMESNLLQLFNISLTDSLLENLNTRTIVTLLIIFFLSLIYLKKSLCQNFPPGPWGYPFIGSLKLLQERPHLHLSYLQKKYGDIYSLGLGKYRAVVACSVEAIQEGLIKNSHKFSGRSAIFSNRVLFNGHTDGGMFFLCFF